MQLELGTGSASGLGAQHSPSWADGESWAPWAAPAGAAGFLSDTSLSVAAVLKIKATCQAKLGTVLITVLKSPKNDSSLFAMPRHH